MSHDIFLNIYNGESASAYYIKRHQKSLRDRFKDVLRLCAAHQLCLSPAPVIRQSDSPPPTFSTPLPRFSPTTPTCSHFFSELGKNREGHLRWQMPLGGEGMVKKKKEEGLNQGRTSPLVCTDAPSPSSECPSRPITSRERP